MLSINGRLASTAEIKSQKTWKITFIRATYSFIAEDVQSLSSIMVSDEQKAPSSHVLHHVIVGDARFIVVVSVGFRLHILWGTVSI